MTFSILAYDEKMGVYGGAAATGSLCVGGWVLRGDAESGLSASQGTSPSTLWGTEALRLMRDGLDAEETVRAVTQPDPGRAHRQLAVLDQAGQVAAFTGDRSVPIAGSVAAEGVIVTGNMLANDRVLPAILAAYEDATGAMPDRLQAALLAGQSAGGDSRGLLSAALLVVARETAPLSLRIDCSDDPLTALAALFARSQSEPYRSWTAMVPTLDDPFQDGTHPDGDAAADLQSDPGNGAPDP